MVFYLDLDPLLIFWDASIFAGIILITLGFYHEQKIADWEGKQIRRLKRFILRQVHKSEKIMRWAQK